MNYKRKLINEISSAVEARLNCQKSGNTEWFEKHTMTITELCKSFLPSGSGFDSGTKIDLDKSHAEKLVFYTSFHHMNDTGYYDGWTEHTITVAPGFNSPNIRISGHNRNDVKELIHQTFNYALTEWIDWNKERECWTRADRKDCARNEIAERLETLAKMVRDGDETTNEIEEAEQAIADIKQRENFK
jgi:hypothetical protein